MASNTKVFIIQVEMKKIFFTIFSFLWVLAFPSNVLASIYINEISPSTDPEWIELYNDSGSSVDLTGYLLEDGNSSSSDDISLSGTISAYGFLVFTHSEGWLNNGGDTVKLYNNASPSAVIDQYTYGNMGSSESVARMPNGSSNWQVTSNVTQNSSNPIPTPATTSTPTITPTPTPTRTPTPTPLKTKTPTPSPTPTPEVLGTQTGTPADISGIRGSMSTSDPTPTPKVGSRGPFPVIAGIFVGLGVLVVIFGIFLAYRQRKSPTGTL